jgi:phosphoenolpyruvate carboxykinase (ATP)
MLVGDDEHGWGDSGVFNFEGGCYAKTIRLSAGAEPEIWKASHSYGTILENVAIDDRGVLDLDDDSRTENTRAAYKLEVISNAVPTKMAGHPQNVVFLTADAFGILPPIARLSRDQALYYFLSGFTAKLAGTEIGVKEPQATFSACFGAPFMPRHPGEYAAMLAERLEGHGVSAWLVNTGWTGGPYGTGERMDINHTRSMVRAALDGRLDGVETVTDPIFGIEVPTSCTDVPPTFLQPRATWADPDAYDRQAQALAHMFVENFATYADGVSASVRAAGPRVTHVGGPELPKAGAGEG